MPRAAEEAVGAATADMLTARGTPEPRRTEEQRGSKGWCSTRRGATNPLFLLSILLPLLLLSGNALGQRPQRQNMQPTTAKKPTRPGKAKTVTDLFNSSSCARPPYRCPYPRIEFYLYTRSTQEEPEKLDLLVDAGPALMETHFDAAHPTKIVIHGFGGGRKLSPSPDMRKAYFTRGEYNVVIVDYSSLVVEPCLSQVEWGPRFCALCIAQLIGWLDDAWRWSIKNLLAANRVTRQATRASRWRHFDPREDYNGEEDDTEPSAPAEDGNFGQRVVQSIRRVPGGSRAAGGRTRPDGGAARDSGRRGHGDATVRGRDGGSRGHGTVDAKQSSEGEVMGGSDGKTRSESGRRGYGDATVRGRGGGSRGHANVDAKQGAAGEVREGSKGKTNGDGEVGERIGVEDGAREVTTTEPRRLRFVGSPPQGVHVIGYSVGAHIAGLLANYVGERKIGRITGLDPTIIFYMGNNRSRDLDPTDALFVDVIHTGAGVLGQWGPNGHVDFYVNGGTSQPGCTGGIYETLACDHQKVTPYFIESITSTRGFWATPCSNLLLYLIGWCKTEDESKLIKMGEDVPHSARGIYYLETNARKPYAKGLPSDMTRRKRRGRG